MSYDLMNRRDQVTKHHSSVTDSLETIQNYLDIEAPPEKINRKFAPGLVTIPLLTVLQ
jgi:chitinase